jgi:hypothetical protein
MATSCSQLGNPEAARGASAGQAISLACGLEVRPSSTGHANPRW